MNQDKQLQYFVKIINALSDLFNEDSENFIDIHADDFSANDFIHVLATRAPQKLFQNLTENETDPLGFNHICNRLIFQDKADDCN